MSDEDKAKPSKSVMGNLPSTRPTRMARRRDGDPRDRGPRRRPRPSRGRRTKARPKPTAGDAGQDQGEADPAGGQAEGRLRRGGLQAARRALRLAVARPPPRSPSARRAARRPRSAARAPSSSPPPSRRRASWPRSASRSAARRSSAPRVAASPEAVARHRRHERWRRVLGFRPPNRRGRSAPANGVPIGILRPGGELAGPARP